MSRIIAVITGDIIDSRHLQPADRLSAALDDALALLASRFDARAERYRGDGFQLALATPRHAVNAAVLLRAELIRRSPRSQRWDARLAIAIGPDPHWHDMRRLAEASAPPYVASGQTLDRLTDNHHLSLQLPGDTSGCLPLLIRHLDELIGGWTPAAAEVVARRLCHADSQKVLAEGLGISQPAVHKRLRTARWPLLNDTLAYLERRLTEESDSP